jgi:c-di-GMP-binding flagellar brake protein YcgR
MGMTSPFPEPDSPDLERYMVYSRAEIVGMLRNLRDACVLVTAYFDADPGFGVTTLLGVDDASGTLVFDNLSVEVSQRRLLASPKVTFVGFVDAIKVQFSGHGARAIKYEGKPAFAVPLPDHALRLQRRDAFRVRPPLSKPATCRVPLATEAGHFEGLRVLDISIGGLAVLTYPEQFDLSAGMTIEGCQLDLPGVGGTSVNLRVRHIDPLPRDEKARRCGCEFVNMAPATQLMLARYVNQLDAEARRLGGAAR